MLKVFKKLKKPKSNARSIEDFYYVYLDIFSVTSIFEIQREEEEYYWSRSTSSRNARVTPAVLDFDDDYDVVDTQPHQEFLDWGPMSYVHIGSNRIYNVLGTPEEILEELYGEGEEKKD